MTHRLPNRWTSLIALAALAAIAGCARDEERRQAVADVAASQFEAAVAIEQGVDPAKPCAAIKAGAAAIIRSQGRAYPPADHLLPPENAR